MKLTKVDRQILEACLDWKAPFEVVEIRKLKQLQRNRQDQSLKMHRLVKAGMLEYGAVNNTFKATPAGRQALKGGE